MESTPSGRRTSSSRRSTACKSRHSTNQRACRECNSSPRGKLLLPSCPPPPEIPPPFCFIHMLFFSLMDSCATFSCNFERGDGGGVSPAHNRKETHKQIHSFSHKHTKKNNVRRSEKRPSSFFANRFYLLSWKLFLIYCVRVVRGSHLQTWLSLIQPPLKKILFIVNVKQQSTG